MDTDHRSACHQTFMFVIRLKALGDRVQQMENSNGSIAHKSDDKLTQSHDTVDSCYSVEAK